MNLHELTFGLTHVPFGDMGVSVTDICYDSRKVTPGALFAALSGVKAHGLDYVKDALSRGASAILTDAPLPGVKVPQVISENPRRTLAEMSARFFGDPTKSLLLVGITGTNGKTTTAYLIRHLLRKLGYSCGMMGTVEYDLGDAVIPAPLTTPESVDYSRYLARIRDSGGTHAVTEVSSHALSQYRVSGHRFAAAVFTNLTRDHLDYYGDMEAYAEAKKRLFDQLDPAARAVVNASDSFSDYMVRDCKCPVVRYCPQGRGDVQAKVLHQDVLGTELLLQSGAETVEVESPLVGTFNVENALAAVTAVMQLGFSLQDTAQALESFGGVPGRLQRFETQGVSAFVDYAHTDDALRSALSVLRPLTKGKLWAVFGCGGDRDRGKRPLMARAAEEMADRVIVTSDNPRTEDPARIFQDILGGFREPKRARLVADRAAAIREALQAALPGDVVLVAGKGHEDYQILGKDKIHFDDREQVRDALAARFGSAGRQECA